MNCVWCDMEIIPEVNWKNLFVVEKPSLLCNGCQSNLEIVRGSRCERCSRTSKEKVCPDCQWWKTQGDRDSIDFNFSTFAYNEMMQAMITKWKYRGDYYIGEVFKDNFMASFLEKFASIKKDVIAVPIPLSHDRIQERAFNQAKMLAEFLPIETTEVLTRVHSEKQSKKTRKERIRTENPFFVKQTINKSVVLVDDIYTTGTTLRHAAKLLRENGSPNVYAFTLARG